MDELSLTPAPPRSDNLLSGQYWGELRIFAEVARAKSFNRAAEQLGVSQPTIGRKVRRLQDLIGAQLFVATKNGVHLTQRGEELASALLVLDQSLFSIARDIKARDKDAEGVVRVSITEGLAAIFAVPAIPAFHALHPKIQIHMRALAAFSDLRENQTDMMLTVAPVDRPDLVCRKLGVLQFLPVASTSYVARHGIPTKDTLADHFVVQSHVYETPGPLWKDWQGICAKAHVSHYCDSPFAYAMMIKQGLGVGLLGSYTARDRSAVVLDLQCDAAVQLYAVALADRLATRPVSLVFDWLCETFDESSLWFRPKLSTTELPDTLAAIDMVYDQ